MKGLAKLGALQLVGNAALLWLAYYWLSVGEANAQTLSLSTAIVAGVLLGMTWLHGTSLAYFGQRDRFSGALRTALRRLLLLCLVTIVGLVLYGVLWLWDPKPLVLWLASGLTLITQSPVRPAWILRTVEIVILVLQWCVLPVLLLPVAAGIASHGWSGWSAVRRQIRDWKYWLLTPAILFLGIWVPLWLAKWTPVRGSFSAELASFVARYGLAYLLFVGAGLALAFVTSRGKPVESQLSTVPSP